MSKILYFKIVLFLFVGFFANAQNIILTGAASDNNFFTEANWKNSATNAGPGEFYTTRPSGAAILTTVGTTYKNQVSSPSISGNTVDAINNLNLIVIVNKWVEGVHCILFQSDFLIIKSF